MQDNYVWIDLRWREVGWLEAFRMRLCGWLPVHLATKAISNGLFVKTVSSDNVTVTLTKKGHRLTDIATNVGESSDNCIMLANVLITRGFERSWLVMEEHDLGYSIQKNQIFPNSFKDTILSELAALAWP